MIKVRLEKLESSHSRLRTDSVVGYTPRIAAVGESFHLFGEALNGLPDHVRKITTSPVREVIAMSGSILEFKTANSTYRLEIFGVYPPSEVL